MVLVKDERIPGKPVFHVLPESESKMQVPPAMLQSVAFVYTARPDGTYFEGTAFFVHVPFEANSPRGLLFAITARHVIEGIQSENFEDVYVRVNDKQGGFIHLKTRSADWKFHPTENSADVAALLLPITNNDGTDIVPIPLSMFLSEQTIQNSEMNIGDDVVMTGLFTVRPGEKRNIPIARIGNIAAMPDYLDTNDGPMLAYLVESRSMGGLSGSPVFVQLGGNRVYRTENKITNIMSTPSWHFLGLTHGHWDLDKPDSNAQNVNMGIAVVVPSSKILETIQRKEFMDHLKRSNDAFKKSNMPKTDRATQPETPQMITDAEFESALKKVSQRLPDRPSEPDSEKT